MEKIIDFTNCPVNELADYGGSDRKFGIIYNDKPYMIKFAEKIDPNKKQSELATSSINNCISEYIGSRIAKSIGIPSHETILGNYNGEIVIACRDFCGDEYISHEFAYYMRKKYDSKEIGKLPRIEQIYDVINHSDSLTNIKNDAMKRYWDTFIIDALTANFDRHKGNWGYLVNKYTKETSLAPTYDYGSTLYPALSDSKTKEIISNPKSICERIFVYPTAALLVNNKKVTYRDMLSSNFNKDCTEAMKRIIPKINMVTIRNIIYNTPLIDDNRKAFYITMLQCRKHFLLDTSYEKILQRDYNECALNRLVNGIPYDTTLFNKEWERGLYSDCEKYITDLLNPNNPIEEKNFSFDKI